MVSHLSRVFIIGASFRIPGASNWDEFCDIKNKDLSIITQIKPEFWASRNLNTPEYQNSIYGGLVDDPFFADFNELGIGQREWDCMDPQQRLCLGLTQELLDSNEVSQNTSVFIGASDTGWAQFNLLPSDSRYLLTGTHLSMISARISYHFDLTSISKTIDTSCSSSLVAICDAVQAIQHGHSEYAICGGVNLFNDPTKFDQLMRMKMLSPDHRCFTFKSCANGYVRSEGGILFLLASEQSVRRNSLSPLAEINGYYINNDGLSPGITAPSVSSQILLHKGSIDRASICSNDIGYVECHGTGTPLGDPIELKALAQVFDSQPVIVGSIKTRIGHLESAAGAAGLLHCLSLYKDQTLASVSEGGQTQQFNLSNSQLLHTSDNSILRELSSCDKHSIISSFGFSGTNASLILSPYSRSRKQSLLKVALFPGQGRFSSDLGLEEYNTISSYRSSADHLWSILVELCLRKNIMDVGKSFIDREYKTPLMCQFYSLVHMLSLFECLKNGQNFDFIIGYSFGEYAASIVSNTFLFEDCILCLIERECLVGPNRRKYSLFYSDNLDASDSIFNKYFPHPVIRCSPSAAIYAIPTTLVDLENPEFSDIFKDVDVDYSYHSELCIRKSDLPSSFTKYRICLNRQSKFLPSWAFSSLTNELQALDWSEHFTEQISFSGLLSFLVDQSTSLDIIEISTKPTLKKIVSANFDSIEFTYSSFKSDLIFSPNKDLNMASPIDSQDDFNSSSKYCIINKFVLDYISSVTGIEPSKISTDKSFTRVGLDSLELAQLTSSLYCNFSVSISVEELIGNFQIIQTAIKEVSNRFSSIPTFYRSSDSNISAEINSQSISSTDQSSSSNPRIDSDTREELVHSIHLRARLLPQVSKSRDMRDSCPWLSDPRLIAGYRDIYKDLQFPISSSSASGSSFISVDGKKYLDFTMGFGVQFFGHNPAFIKDVLLDAVTNNSLFLGPQSALASSNAKLLCQLTAHDRALFCNTGTEAVMTAIRLARAHTKRSKILQFNGSYHGHNDMNLTVQVTKSANSAPASMGTLPKFTEDTLTTDYNDINVISQVIISNHDTLAAVLVEPIQSRNPLIDKAKLLRVLRSLCTKYGIILIFDEVLIGFRCNLASSLGFFGVKSDLSVFGKIIGGGLPIGAVAGNESILSFLDGGTWFTNDKLPQTEKIFFAGTFNKNHLTMLACNQVLNYFANDNGLSQYKLNSITRSLCKDLNLFFLKRGLSIRVAYASSFFRFLGAPPAFYLELLYHGIYIWEGRTCFLSLSHSHKDIEYFKNSVSLVTDRLISHGILSSDILPSLNYFLLSETQISLCASYLSKLVESQSFNQVVVLKDFSSYPAHTLLNLLIREISCEKSLFGIYDIASCLFTPGNPSTSDWIFYSYDSTDLRPVLFSPIKDDHVVCIVDLNDGKVFSISLYFAHYAIDGKGINNLFNRVFNLPSYNSVIPHTPDYNDITNYCIDQFNHFNYISYPISCLKPSRLTISIDSIQRDRFIVLCEQNLITLPTLLFSLYIYMLKKIIDVDSFVVALFGTIDLFPSECFLYSTFIQPIPFFVDSTLSFSAADFSLIQHKISKLVSNTFLNTSHIASNLNISKASHLYPLADFAFNYDKIADLQSITGLEIKFNPNPSEHARWSLFLNIVDNSNSLEFIFDYDDYYFKDSSIRSVFNEVIDFLTYNDLDCLCNLTITSPVISSISMQTVSLSKEINVTGYLSYLCDSLSLHKISDSATCWDSNLLYDKLSQVICILEQHKDNIICIRTSDIKYQVLFILACWSCSKSYVLWNFDELDKFNQDRISLIGISLILSLSECGDPFISILTSTLESNSSVQFEDLAHLIFTSGSTGSSKAVPISVNHLASYQSSLITSIVPNVYDNSYRFAILSSLNYDFPFSTILLWLRFGGELFVADACQVSTKSFWESLPSNYFSFLKIVPAYFSSLSDLVSLSSLLPSDVLMFGGDSLPSSVAMRCYEYNPSIRIYTHYGPTETCIGCSTYKVPHELPLSESIVPIGKALSGYSIDILMIDSQSSYIAPNLGQISNIGQVQITTSNTYGSYYDGSFHSILSINNTFSHLTGDFGYWDSNCNLCLVGRTSGLLKINGFKIYISDVFLRIFKLLPTFNIYILPIAKSDFSHVDSDHFVLFIASLSISSHDIHDLLRKSLPSHYVPRFIHLIDCIPLTSNGKVDTSSLLPIYNSSFLMLNPPVISSDLIFDSFLEACSVIFTGVSISMESNFFMLGGDSLSAIRLSASLYNSGFIISSNLILANPDFHSIYILSQKDSILSPVSEPYSYIRSLSQIYIQQSFPTLKIDTWPFTFLISCPKRTAADVLFRLIALLRDIKFCSLNVSFKDIEYSEYSEPYISPALCFSSFVDFENSLQTQADSLISHLNPAVGLNFVASCITINNDYNFDYLILSFPHFLIDFLSVQLLLDSVSTSSYLKSNLIFGSKSDILLNPEDYFQYFDKLTSYCIQSCKYAPFDYRLNVDRDLFRQQSFLLDISSIPLVNNSSLSITFLIFIILFLVSNRCIIHDSEHILFDIEFGSRSSNSIGETGIGYFTKHIPCIFSDLDPVSVYQSLRYVQNISSELLATLNTNCDLFPFTPYISLNIVDNSVRSTSASSLNILKTSFSSSESISLPWSPMIIEVLIDTGQLASILITYDPSFFSDSVISSMSTSLAPFLATFIDTVITDESDILDRLGW